MADCTHQVERVTMVAVAQTVEAPKVESMEALVAETVEAMSAESMEAFVAEAAEEETVP